MKKLSLTILALLFVMGVYAQTEGTIKYISVTQLNFEAPEGMEEMFKNMPKETSSEKVLLYSRKKSIYQNPDDKIGNENNMVKLGGDNMQIEMDFNEPDEKLYIDQESEKMTHQKDFMGKQFLVQGTPMKTNWKLGNGKKKIAGYICLEATAVESDTIAVTAWFSPQIPASIGPNGYGGLPGLILQIDRDNGNQLTTATAINLDAPNIELIIEPTNGKKITEAKFEKIVMEKMAELQAQSSGSGGSTFIQIRQ